MSEKKLQQNFQSIPFWRRRWLWAAVMGVGVVVLYVFFPSLDCPLYTSVDKIKNIFSTLALGFTVGILLPFTIIHLIPIDQLSFITHIVYAFGSWSLSVFFIIYYIILFTLVYKTFRNSKIKIRYPLFFIIIMALSVLGGTVLLFSQRC